MGTTACMRGSFPKLADDVHTQTACCWLRSHVEEDRGRASPCACVAHSHVERGASVQGRLFSVPGLLADEALGYEYQDCSMMIFRLAPQGA